MLKVGEGEGGKSESSLLLPPIALEDQLIPADRLMQEPLAFKNSGLFDSSDGIGRFTSVPKLVPAFDVLSGSYGPFGKTDSALRLYCQIKRRISPRRCDVRKRSTARSWKSRFCWPAVVVGIALWPIGAGEGSGWPFDAPSA